MSSSLKIIFGNYLLKIGQNLQQFNKKNGFENHNVKKSKTNRKCKLNYETKLKY